MPTGNAGSPSRDAFPASRPETTYSGDFKVRVSPQARRGLMLQAAGEGATFNRFASDKLAGSHQVTSASSLYPSIDRCQPAWPTRLLRPAASPQARASPNSHPVAGAGTDVVVPENENVSSSTCPVLRKRL
ncbi:MAG: toxin-antitoxin system HicB family antitoxin [Burkholderiales bacterium]|nr:toxin-antitoxin system HicB family antitoxin [Burkholderiales bacterium]